MHLYYLIVDDGTQNLQRFDIKLDLPFSFFLPQFFQMAKGDPEKTRLHKLASYYGYVYILIPILHILKFPC